MKTLFPNTGDDFILISKNDFYVRITDFKTIQFLKEIKIGPGQHTWEWISFKANNFIDLNNIDNNYCTFNNAINRSINNLYCTVYKFKNIEEMMKNWDEIKYVDNITTTYSSEQTK
jgi:hypothetical protein